MTSPFDDPAIAAPPPLRIVNLSIRTPPSGLVYNPAATPRPHTLRIALGAPLPPTTAPSTPVFVANDLGRAFGYTPPQLRVIYFSLPSGSVFRQKIPTPRHGLQLRYLLTGPAVDAFLRTRTLDVYYDRFLYWYANKALPQLRAAAAAPPPPPPPPDDPDTRGYYTPAQLAQALNLGTGAAPAMPILRLCYSGQIHNTPPTPATPSTPTRTSYQIPLRTAHALIDALTPPPADPRDARRALALLIRTQRKDPARRPPYF